jgi:hypothetical protein
MSEIVVSQVQNRTIKFTATDLGFTTALLGSGTLVTLIEKLPEGWSIRAAQVRMDGTITNAGGTTVLNVGVTAAETAIVNGLDIEGATGWKTPTVVRYDSLAAIAVVARVVTATAAASAVAGVTIGLDLCKVGIE